MNEEENQKIIKILDSLKNYPIITTDAVDFFNLFDNLFEDKTYLQLLKAIDKDIDFTFKTKKEIQKELLNIFEKDVLSKITYLHITFLYLRRKCIIEAETNSDKIKEALYFIKCFTKG